MRILHVVKTSNGALWAARQVRQLVRMGVNVHVALPSFEGLTMPLWRETGAQLLRCNLNFPTKSPWQIADCFARVRRIVDQVQPDAIHTHFVTSTMTVRGALGPNHPIPRIFQVPGPLHLEHALYRSDEIMLAGKADHWIASSECIRSLYLKAGIPPARVFLSYYGFYPDDFSGHRTGSLREKFGIAPRAFVVGNINLVYKPKRYLGQFIGLKAHEDVIQALRLVIRQRNDVFGLLIGGPWGNGHSYFAHLRSKASQIGNNRIFMPGPVAPDEVPGIWPEFDCAVHVPISENCGGVVEPLASGVPTIAGRVGGLPEVVIDGVTGLTVSIRQPEILAQAILDVLGDLTRHRQLATAGQKLVQSMFAVERTASEVKRVYEYLLGHSADRPSEFSSCQAVACGA